MSSPGISSISSQAPRALTDGNAGSITVVYPIALYRYPVAKDEGIIPATPDRVLLVAGYG